MLIASFAHCEAENACQRLSWNCWPIVRCVVWSPRPGSRPGGALRGGGWGITSDTYRWQNPSPQSSPVLQLERRRKLGRSQLTTNEHYRSSFPQPALVHFFRPKANQREVLDPSAARLDLPSAENQRARDWLARFLYLAHQRRISR